MKQAAKGLILLAFSLSANSKFMFASVQLDKNISCLFRKAQAGKKDAAKYICVEGQQKTSAASAALAACNARQRQLLTATGRAVLPICKCASPSDLQVFVVTDRQVARRQQKLVD